MCRTAIASSLAVAALWAADPNCPAYPQPQRKADLARIELERSAHSYALGRHRPSLQPVAASANFVDEFLFTKMARDGVRAAPLISDAEFLRRVMLDLTGRIPKPEQVQQFLKDPIPQKRMVLIDSLIGSEAFVDRWTMFFGDLFEVTSGYYNLIGIPGRNLFHNYLRDFVQNDRSYRDVAVELITATGDSHLAGPPNFLVRGMQQGDPIQDTWDVLTDRVTSTFLGVKTECVSCHHGRGHLEPINVYLTSRRREEFWRQSAFFSRMTLTSLPADAFSQQFKLIVKDRLAGGYHGVVNPGNPGPRPTRTGGPYEPVYMFTGERPRSGEWRQELGRMLGADRQFARVAVNYLWAHFFRAGIVDPPDGWDLSRIDPKNPPPAPWTLQPSHPELLDALADEFARGNFRIRPIIRLIAESSAYQLSSRYPGEWKPEYARYFAKQTPRRLTAEEVHDALATATLTETPMFVEGFEKPLMYAMQLPDPTEPRNNGGILNLLSNFGRGNWWQNARSSGTTVLQVLYLMNDNQVNFRTFGNRDSSRNTRVALLMGSGISDQAAVEQLFLATLGRSPSAAELGVVNKSKTGSREQWLSDLQWALLNKLDFVFNY